MDVMTPAQRSRCMSRIRGVNTKPELALRRALWQLGLRYRLHQKLPGKPDLTFGSARVVVFVDGCFWHACPAHQTQPKTNAAFWRNKIASNVARDAIVNSALEADGWEILRFWEHEVNDNLAAVVSRVRRAVQKRKPRRR
jgi:DNA mismatch endonuclease (patch repair protein)